MALAPLLAAFEADLNQLDGHFRAFVVSKPSITSSAQFTLLDEALIEGLLSRVWQAWCGFCRESVVRSCMGANTVSGVAILPLPQATSVELVSGAVLKAKRAAPSLNYWGVPNATLRLEPTWGDVDVLNLIVPRLAPSNHGQILAAVSSASPNAKILQKIRNAAAHRNNQTMAEVTGFSSAFVTFPITDPVHALFWQEPGSKSFVINYTIAELKTAAAAMAA